MKSTLGKLGMGFAGAVAFAGLMCAGVQTAQAQLQVTLSTGTNPIETALGVYKWVYNVNFYGDVTNPTTTNSVTNTDYILMTGFSSADWLSNQSNSMTISGVSSSDWSFNEVTGVGNPVYSGLNVINYSPTNIQGLEISFNGYSNGDSSHIVSGTVGTLTLYDSLNSNNIDTYYFNMHQDTSSTGYAGNSSTIMPASVSITGQPLPLPAAFWPGLLTIGGMAVVGGLRLRRRTV